MTEDEETFLFHQEADVNDIPPSLLSYFESSKSRAAACEKLILEELGDFTASHHTEDTMNSPAEPDNDEWKLNQKVIWDGENEEINTYTDTSLPPAPTDVEALFTPNNEDETEADEHMESERHLALEVSLNEEERKKNSEYEAEREKRHCEEMEREERKRQIERDFQEELKKIMEAEKLHQKELELMERRAQEKLEQELQLQQELISNLKRRVEEERRVREEEQKRIKDEEDKRKREEEKIKVEAERRRMEEETRRKEEEERTIQEVKRKKEEERKKEEQEKRRMEREEKRKREEERKKSDLEKKKLEEEMRMMEEEEERKNGEKMERMMMEEERKREEERRKEEAKKKIGKERRKTEEEMSMRKVEESRKKDEEEERKREEEKIKAESERKGMEEEMIRKKEEERRIEEMKLIKEEEKKKEEQEKRRMEREEKRKREEERKKLYLEKKKLEEEMRMMKEEEEQKNREKMERMMMEEERKREEERRKEEKKKRKVEEDVSMRKEEEYQTKEEGEERKKREEKNTRIEGKLKETDKRKKQDEIIKKKEEEEDSNKIYEEMRKSYKREHGHIDEEVKLEEKTMVKEAVRKGEGENSKKKEELRPIEEDERRKQDDEWKTKEGERRKQKEEIRRQHDEEDSKKSEEEIRLKEEKEAQGHNNRTMEHESKIKDKEKKQEKEEEEKKQVKEEMRIKEEERKNAEGEKEQNKDEMRGEKKEVNQKTGKEIRVEAKEEGKMRRVEESEKKIRVGKANELQEKRENHSMKKSIDKTEKTEDGTAWTSSDLGPLHSESTVDPGSSATTQQLDPDKDIGQTSADKTAGCENQAAVPACLPEHTEQRRLSWMKDCIPWSKLSLQNRRKQKRSVQSRGGRRRVSEAGSLLPLCPNSLLESTGRKSLQEVTTVTLEDLPGCSLSTLAQCAQLRSLTLRRCGLKSLEDINKLAQLCYIDVQENDISFIDCDNMTSLRVLRLARNKLTSIHGLSGAENLDVLDLSHNSITRIAGLESVRRLQRLSLDHNQLISTKGLKDVYTLLYLNCSHNHLASVEGLENSALLNTLDLRANSLTEPPRLKNQVLLRELHLDDNSISSLLDLTACWLPLLQHLSVAQNRITQLPSMSDSVSLANLDLRFNCISELQNVCESLEGCQFLREVRLTGNPLQQESGWRSTLQRAVPGLRAIDGQETDSFVSPPAVQQVSSASGSFLTFCQAQLQQTRDLQQRHSRELSNASSSLDAVETSCRHFTEALQLAEDQRFAHEYGDTSVADKHGAAGQTAAEETLDLKVTDIGKCTERPEMESNGKAPPVIPKRDNMRCSAWTFEEKSAADSRHDTFDTVTDSKMEPAIKKIDSGSVHSLAKEGKPISSNLNMASVSNHQNLDVKNTAAVVIQQLWRKYRQKCGNISSPSTAEKGGGRGGDGEKPESGPSCINGSQDYAAAVIQAFWRGFALRRRLASALAAVTCLDTGEDDTFDEVDVDEFVFDEGALEKHWTLSLSEDSLPRSYSVLEQPLSLKPPERFPEPSQYTVPPPLVGRSKQAWVAGEPVASAGQRVSPVSSNRSRSPASPLVVSGLSERSEKILEEWGFTHSHTALLMLKRAQNMKSKKHQQRKRRDPSVRLALFRNCSYQPGPVETHNRKAQNNRNDIKVPEAELGLQQAEGTERARQERAQQNTQAAQPDRDSESVRFLPEISSDILNGGRVQLVADPGYTERPHHASGLWANSRLAAQPRKENNYPRRNSLGHARKEAPSPKRVTSPPSKTERISFRDNPVQLSAGWGGGKKRDKVYK